MELALVLAVDVRNWRLEFPGARPEELALSPQISLHPRDGVVVRVTRR